MVVLHNWFKVKEKAKILPAAEHPESEGIIVKKILKPT